MVLLIVWPARGAAAADEQQGGHGVAASTELLHDALLDYLCLVINRVGQALSTSQQSLSDCRQSHKEKTGERR